MKNTLVLAAALLALGACSHKQVREPSETSRVQTTTTTVSPIVDTGTVSGSPSSLGAVSSGRGH